MGNSTIHNIAISFFISLQFACKVTKKSGMGKKYFFFFIIFQVFCVNLPQIVSLSQHYFVYLRLNCELTKMSVDGLHNEL